MSLTDGLTSFLNASNDVLWIVGFLILVPLGISLTLRYRAVQITKVKDNCQLAFDKTGDDKQGSISSYEAFLIGLGERVGVGNIIAVAAAIMAGGPGAVFWMWVFAIINAIVSFAETTLSQIYKSKREDGMYVGGPAYNATKAFGKEDMGKYVAVLYVFVILVVVCTVTSCYSDQFRTISFIDDSGILLGISLAILLTIIALKGMKSVARLSRVLVPAMALFWIVLCLIVIAINWRNIGNAFGMILHYAFVVPDEIATKGFLSIEGVWEGIKGPIGGLIGTVIVMGLKRGIFSNEGGLGTVSIASSTADVEHPVKQGLVQSFAVLIDTLVICSCTAFVILTFGDFGSICELHLDNAPLVTEIMARTLLGGSAKYIITVLMFIFTLTTILSFMNMIESTTYLIDKRKIVSTIVKCLLVATAAISCCIKLDVAFVICDITFALCAMINCAIIFRLRHRIKETYDDYTSQREQGVKNPVFHKDALSDDTGVTEWD